MIARVRGSVLVTVVLVATLLAGLAFLVPHGGAPNTSSSVGNMSAAGTPVMAGQPHLAITPATKASVPASTAKRLHRHPRPQLVKSSLSAASNPLYKPYIGVWKSSTTGVTMTFGSPLHRGCNQQPLAPNEAIMNWGTNVVCISFSIVSNDELKGTVTDAYGSATGGFQSIVDHDSAITVTHQSGNVLSLTAPGAADPIPDLQYAI